jgi:hypothetical protein
MAISAMMEWAFGPILGGKGALPDGRGLLGYTLSSGFFIGFQSVIGVMRLLAEIGVTEPAGELLSSFPGFCLIASAVFALYSALLAVWIRLILLRRLARHPFTLADIAKVAAVSDAGI